MSKKIDRALHGPSWTEVILGAVLSVVLGVVLAAALMIFRPVIAAKDTPKAEERVKGAVYYIEGTRDTAKSKQAPEKRKSFAAGQSVTVVEDELNVLANPNPAAPAAAAKGAPPPPAPKTAEKGKVAKAPEKAKEAPKAAAPAPAPAAGKAAEPLVTGPFYTVGAPNFRIRDGAMQIAVPVTITTLDLGLKVVAQARGGFAKQDASFMFEPTELYLGSCPVQRIPILNAYVREKFIGGLPVPDDIKTSWGKLAGVALEGTSLKLTMP